MGKNWAITIGINQYHNLQSLRFAQQDADAMRDFFLQDINFEQVYHFTNTSPAIEPVSGPPIASQPTFGTLRRFLRSRFEQPFLEAGDNFWFFFAGHGIRSEDRDYLMPLDVDPGDVEATAIPVSYVTERLRRCGADNVILLVDACRSQGRRTGLGVGGEPQQGVVSLFSCSPQESSYEIEQIGQGAFTRVLLEGLRLQGEGNCATVERLCHYLSYQVPLLNRRYEKPMQKPYAVVEPASKYHLILLPQRANVQDVNALKKDALEAEVKHDLQLAKQYWIRVLTASPGDSEAVDGIERLARTSSPLPSSGSTVSASPQSDARQRTKDSISPIPPDTIAASHPVGMPIPPAYSPPVPPPYETPRPPAYSPPVPPRDETLYPPKTISPTPVRSQSPSQPVKPAEPVRDRKPQAKPTDFPLRSISQLKRMHVWNILVLVSMIVLFVLAVLQKQAVNTKQSEAKSFMSAMNRAQQANYIEFSNFANSFEDSKIGIPADTKNYRYSIELPDGKSAIAFGQSKDPNLKSYTGAVFLVTADWDPNAFTTIQQVCETDTPSTTPPDPPTLNASGEIECAPGSKPID